jgi:AraC-like DNA-binding protein
MQNSVNARSSQADVPPHVIRQVLQLAASRGHSLERLCRGLGFAPDNLRDADFRVSYRQTSLLVHRAMKVCADPAIGIATGARQTVVSFGLPGLGMLTCPTLGEALSYLIKYQRSAGAITDNKYLLDERHFTVEATPRFHDPELEPFFVEEVLVSGVALARSLIGSHYRPACLELRYPKPAHASAYSEFFRCPVSFNAQVNRLVSDAAWYHCPLLTYDSFMEVSMQAQIDQLLTNLPARDDLVESVLALLRAEVDDMAPLPAIAARLNLSERTLRRRLGELDTSYQGLVDQVRYEAALDLLKRTDLSLVEIALATGFTDARNFRRAFKRWAGMLPNQVRQAAL